MVNYKMSKDAYLHWCSNNDVSPIFSQPWWLNTVCGQEHWDVVTIFDGEKLLAALPYYKRKKFAFSIISQPSLTQVMGPWINPELRSKKDYFGVEKKLLTHLVELLPDFDFFSQTWCYEYQNFLPFYWQGFSQTTRFTYVLEDLSDPASLLKKFKDGIRSDINKALNRFKLEVRTEDVIDDFIEINELVFKRQGMKLPYTKEYLKRIYSAANTQSKGKVFVAYDELGRAHAGVFVVWDSRSAYYIAGGGDPELRNSGATSLCMWTAIKFCSTVTKRFDFEGSMIPPVEKFFSSFGSVQKAYNKIQKSNSVLISVLNSMRK